MILIKITTLQRKADCEQLQVLAAKHTASLQLLSIVDGNQTRLDARTEFEISQRPPNGGWKHKTVLPDPLYSVLAHPVVSALLATLLGLRRSYRLK